MTRKRGDDGLVYIDVGFPPELIKKIDHVMKKKGYVRRSEFIRKCVIDYLDSHGD